MQTLTEIALERANSPVFGRQELDCWVPGTPDRQSALLRRALAAGEVLRVHRGLYALAEKFTRQKIDPLPLAQRIHGPSYISLETALSWHRIIPEAVYAITSVSLDRAREFNTQLGVFSYTRIPQEVLYTAVTRTETIQGNSFLMASPLKSLADYVYVHKCAWTSVHPVVESLRGDLDLLVNTEAGEFDELIENYTSTRVLRFLQDIKKEFGK